jgi:hypothetical protein
MAISKVNTVPDIGVGDLGNTWSRSKISVTAYKKPTMIPSTYANLILMKRKYDKIKDETPKMVKKPL